MKTEKKGFLTLFIFLMTTMLACSVPGFSGGEVTPVPEEDSDFLSFTTIPGGYTVSLNPGDRVTGSRLEYIGQEGDAYRVRINGQESLKRIGDSFSWAGIIAPGVYGSYNLRLTTTLLGALPVTGSVKLTILDWVPTELATLPDMTNALHFDNILAIQSSIPTGGQFPASTMVYNGLVTQGDTTYAQISGNAGNANYALGDSVVWTGQLRDNVFVRYNLRVISFDENSILLEGGSEIWVTDVTYR